MKDTATTKVGSSGIAGYVVKQGPLRLGMVAESTLGESFDIRFEDQTFFIGRNKYQGTLRVQVESSPWIGSGGLAGMEFQKRNFVFQCEIIALIGKRQKYRVTKVEGLNLTVEDRSLFEKYITDQSQRVVSQLMIQVLYQF